MPSCKGEFPVFGGPLTGDRAAPAGRKIGGFRRAGGTVAAGLRWDQHDRRPSIQTSGSRMPQSECVSGGFRRPVAQA
jgi:hypothetical protein